MKQFLLFSAALFTLAASAQISTPNGNFETWISDTYDYPQYYPLTSNPSTFFRSQTPFNLTKTTDAYHGTYAVQLTTNASVLDTSGGYFVSTSSANGDPTTWKGGIPYNQTPTGIRGYYKYNIATADSGLILVIFKKAGVAYDFYPFLIGGIKTTYTLFNFSFNLVQTPDTVIFAAASGNLLFTNGLAGESLFLDSVSFTGVASQPAQFNGDFETWQTQTIMKPASWYNDGGDQGEGLLRTTDVNAGTYALELKTTLSLDDLGNPIAQPGLLSTGYYNNNCGCQQGGYPYTLKKDTLAFYYKYTPTVSTDSANISLQFKKNGAYVGFAGMDLPASAAYMYKEIPFDLGVVPFPDSVIVSIQSSLWTHELPTYIGADLKIDDLHFKSQSVVTGIRNSIYDKSIRFYPNPVKTFGIVEISPEINIQGMELRIYDLSGRTIKAIPITNHKMTIDKNGLQAGTYLYTVKDKSGILKSGKILVE